MKRSQTRDGFINTCQRCEHQELCHALILIRFEDYLPGSPGYIPLCLCSDNYSETTFPEEAASSKLETRTSREPRTLADHQDAIMVYLANNKGNLITAVDVKDHIELGPRHTGHILMLLFQDGRVTRHKAGGRYYYALPGVKVRLPVSERTQIIRKSIIKALADIPMTTPEIKTTMSIKMSTDAVRNHIQRMANDGIVGKVGESHAWELV